MKIGGKRESVRSVQYRRPYRLGVGLGTSWIGWIVLLSVMGLVRMSPAAPQVNLLDIITSVRVFPNLGFVFPMSLVQLAGDDSHWYLAEQGGRIYRFLNDDQVTEKQLILDITERLGGAFFNDSQQWGITGIALHTNTSETELAGQVVLFVAYNARLPEDGSVTSFVSRFLSQDGGQTFDASSEAMLFAVPQRSVTHHLGHLVFGPDGYLYIGFGDGAMPPTAQDLSDVRGSILRVDVNVNGPGLYTIPTDNPLVGTGQREEIFTWGWRNPWRFSLDATTGDLWVGNVGFNEREEVTRAWPQPWLAVPGRHAVSRDVVRRYGPCAAGIGV